MGEIRRGPVFDAESVRAILDGRKTQTRRVVRDVDHRLCESISPCDGVPGVWYVDQKMPASCFDVRHPYGRPGDRLWCRERFLPDPPADHDAWDDHYMSFPEFDGCGRKAGYVPRALASSEHCLYQADGEHELIWKSSLFMPRWASRLWIEVVDVRVERLQQTPLTECWAEGCPFAQSQQAIDWYHERWDALNAKRGFGWEVNPWVWVIGFRRIESPDAAAPRDVEVVPGSVHVMPEGAVPKAITP